MAMIPREITPRLTALATGFPVVSVTGPRQSGKTTAVRHAFPQHAYVSLENLDTMAAAREDPRRFLRPHQETGVIIDEAQRVPELFAYLQGMVDESGRMGRYILTGSQDFLLLEKVAQSLAGRTAVLHLLPFSASEIDAVGSLSEDLDEVMFKGFYPPLFDRPVAPSDFLPAYLETYVERDVRSMRNIGDLSLFRRFLLLCAGRVGQLLNLTALGNEVGVDHKTIRAWLSVLEAGFIAFLLPPYHRNWNKRITKQPKLYFHDTGLLCSLLGLRGPSDLASHPLRGAIFECFVVADCLKRQLHAGRRPSLYFWRAHAGHEVDLLIEHGPRLNAVEIKSAETVHPDLFAGLRWFCANTGVDAAACTLVYGGVEAQDRKAGRVVPWRLAHRHVEAVASP